MYNAIGISSVDNINVTANYVSKPLIKWLLMIWTPQVHSGDLDTSIVLCCPRHLKLVALYQQFHIDCNHMFML